jgi:predicted SAM-dependent methyltransferase
MSQERYRQHVQGVFRQVRYLNVGTRFPLSDASVDCVYSQHLLEHLYPEVAKSCLSESFRVLKPGGILRVCIPDLDLMVRGYDSSNPEPFLDAIFEGRQARDKNRHHWHYNKVSMEALLKSVGFPQIFTCGYREGRCPDLASVENRPESLFMEAIK